MFRKIFVFVFFFIACSAFGQVPTKFTTFSFASDDTHNSPTIIFSGNGTTIQAYIELNLMVDVNDDNFGGQITFQTRFNLQADTYDYKVIPCGSGFLHIWKVKGVTFFDHADPTAPGNRLLTIDFEQAVLTSLSPSPSDIGQTLTLQDGDLADPRLSIKSDTILIGAGVDPGELLKSRDFAFTFSKARDPFGTQLIPLSADGLWQTTFATEGSFSATGHP
jgi:hypothetical protein